MSNQKSAKNQVKSADDSESNTGKQFASDDLFFQNILQIQKISSME